MENKIQSINQSKKRQMILTINSRKGLTVNPKDDV